jgi:formylglycine-generating enzyme required for sulfatase activity
MREAVRGANGAGAERVNAKDGSVLVHVPGDVFTIGADDMSERERPAHRVQLSPFWIAKHPVTNAQYAAFLQERPQQPKPAYWDKAEFNTPEQPVIGVSWDDAAAYAAWAGLVLPTEAQWEAAARGTDGRRYPWGPERPDEQRANFGMNVARTTPVGAYPAGAGPYGTLDQAGNVWEWCLDPWDSGAYAKRVATGRVVVDPVNAGDTAVRAVRGGSWYVDPEFLAAACRIGLWAGGRVRLRGFRCAWSPRA